MFPITSIVSKWTPQYNREYQKEWFRKYREKHAHTLEYKNKHNKWNKEWKAKNREKINIQAKQYRLENKEKIKERDRLYKLNNKEKVSEKSRVYYKKNKTKMLVQNKEWAKQHPLKMRMYKKVHLSRRRALGYISLKIIQLLYEDNIKNFGTLTCILCNLPISFGDDSLEHKIPISRGGNNDYSNLGITHKICNSRKNDKTLEEWICCQ